MSSDKSETRRRILKETWALLEKGQGQGARMSDIAKAASISRQALYLHFESRTDLLIATITYVDEVKNLAGRLSAFQAAETGLERLGALVEVWGNYIPEIYGISKALMTARITDSDADAAWKSAMGCLRDACKDTIETLEKEGRLASPWTPGTATDLFMAMLSIETWEHLVREDGWSNTNYGERMKALLERAFVE